MFKLFGKIGKQKENVEEQLPPVDSALSLLMEVPKNGIIQYFKGLNISVEDTYYNIEEAQFGIMSMSEFHRRIAIVESGTGFFGKKENRVALIDLLGMIDNKSIDATVFFTDYGMKNQIQKTIKENCKKNSIEEPNIEFILYEDMGTVYATLKGYNENYIVDGAKDKTLDNPLDYKAEEVQNKTREFITTEYKDVQLLVKESNDETDGIKEFSVKI